MPKRKINKREVTLLIVFLLLADLMGYLYLFRMPTVQARDDYLTRKADCETQILLFDQQLIEKEKMEKELKALFDKNPNPLSMSPYDNLKKVVVELNGILQPMEDYTLTFGKIEENGNIIHRPVSLSFNCSGYRDAKNVLKQLHDSSYRCMLDSVNMSIPNGAGDEGLFGWTGEAPPAPQGVSVQATMIYFEYKEGGEAPAASEAETTPAE